MGTGQNSAHPRAFEAAEDIEAGYLRLAAINDSMRWILQSDIIEVFGTSRSNAYQWLMSKRGKAFPFPLVTCRL
jgi:hypothetical protein